MQKMKLQGVLAPNRVMLVQTAQIVSGAIQGEPAVYALPQEQKIQ